MANSFPNRQIEKLV